MVVKRTKKASERFNKKASERFKKLSANISKISLTPYHVKTQPMGKFSVLNQEVGPHQPQHEICWCDT